ncbi:MAG: IclR family transcriptional regulator [Burkholderiaceae bacterium]|nr:IclR family transcriptional regulator [Burkholderiaceae bacterium]
MTDKPDSSLTRLLAVLDLFDDERLTLTPEAIEAALQVSQPTAYRYVKVLTEAGLLQRQGAATYGLGPRIIMLDRLIRHSDPVLQHAVPYMQELVALTGLDCVSTGLYGDRMLDTHREVSGQPANLSYGRGRPRPLFLGAAPKVMLSVFAAAAQRRVLEQHADEARAAGLPTAWPAFRQHFARIRKAGHYVSRGELEPALGAIAVPLVLADGQVLGAISLVTKVERLALVDVAKLAQLLQRAAGEIIARIEPPA